MRSVQHPGVARMGQLVHTKCERWTLACRVACTCHGVHATMGGKGCAMRMGVCELAGSFGHVSPF